MTMRPCNIEGCEQRRSSRVGMCWTHARRLHRYGSTNPPNIPAPSGPLSATWRGVTITYSGAHMRVRRMRGAAADQECGDCGQQAKQWSYNHSDPAERIDGRGRVYGPNPECYVARCVSCHKVYDFAVRQARL